MPLKCSVQERVESRLAQVDRIIRNRETNEPTEVKFTIVDIDDSQLKGFFYVPEGFDTEGLHEGAAEIWDVRIGVIQTYFGDVALGITAIKLNDTWIENPGQLQ